MGAAAIGVPALMNALVSRRARKLPVRTWGGAASYPWQEGEIAYQHLGEGTPLVLLHSFGPGHSAAEWRAAAETLATSHEIFVPDLLGWGGSQKTSGTYDGELYIRLVSDFLSDVVQRRAVLVAAGLSAAYAVQVAADQPEQVRALALIVPQGIEIHGDEPDLKDAVVHRLLRLPVLGTSALNVFTSRSALVSYLRREVYAAPERVDDHLVDEHYKNAHQQGAHEALAAYLSGYLNHSVKDVLGQLEAPLWIAWGRQAASPAVESADLWLRQQPQAELEVLEGCGVLPHVESTDELCAVLDRFLAGLADEPAADGT